MSAVRATTGIAAISLAAAVGLVTLSDLEVVDALLGRDAPPDRQVAAVVAANLAAGAGVVAVVVGIAGGWASFGPAGAVLLGAGVVAKTGDGPVGPSAAVVAVVLYVLSELVAWSAEARTARPPGTPVPTRLARLAWQSAAGGVAALVVTAGAALGGSSELAVAAAGVGALAACAVLVVGLVGGRETPSGPT